MPWSWSWPFLPNIPLSFQKLCVCEICNSRRTFRRGTSKIRFYFSTALRNFKFKFLHLLIYPAVCSLFRSLCQRFLFFTFHFIILLLQFWRRNITVSFFPLHISIFYLRSLWYESVPPHHQSLYDLSSSFTQRAYMNKSVRYLTKQSIIKYSPLSQCNWDTAWSGAETRSIPCHSHLKNLVRVTPCVLW